MINITPEQNKLLGQLLLSGVPLPIALPIVMDAQAAQAGLTDGVALFEQGANKVLDIIPSLVKPKNVLDLHVHLTRNSRRRSKKPIRNFV